MGSGARLAGYLDHTVLRPDAGDAEVAKACAEALRHGFHAVCVNPLFVPLAARELAGSVVAVCAVVAFPFGALPSGLKAGEAEWVVRQGAAEVDMVLPLGRLKAGDHAAVRADIAAVRQACGPALLKVILETALLTEAEKVAACRLSAEAGADFVKTSTGFAGAGATVEDVALLRRTVGEALGVKASGGIRSPADAWRMIAAGASRLGTSASSGLVDDGRSDAAGARRRES